MIEEVSKMDRIEQTIIGKGIVELGRITKKHCRSGRSEVETKLSLKTKEG